MKNIILFIIFLFFASPALATTYYVRDDGGTSTQCTGLADSAYDGSGTGEACAFEHPSWAIGALGKSGAMSGGDTLIIDNESHDSPGTRAMYVAGLGMPNTSTSYCDSTAPWDCYLATLKAGPTAETKTKIYGKGWEDCENTPSTSKAQLYGTERVKSILLMNDNVEVKCLDITDHSACIEFGPSDGLQGSYPVQCQRNGYPDGDWAQTGIKSAASVTANNVILEDVDVHGIAVYGLYPFDIGNWTLDNVNVSGNGWAGWNADNPDSSTENYTGTIILQNGTSIDYNGCGEVYPLSVALETDGVVNSGNIHHCWGQTQGGYGDGIGTGNGPVGDWEIYDSSVSHNTSDGLDLLHGDFEGTATIVRSRFEGNAGNQIKLRSSSGIIENSIIIGNCGYHLGQSFTSTKDNSGSTVYIETCRPSGQGEPLAFDFDAGTTLKILNSTIISNGDSAIIVDNTRSTACTGASITLSNSIVYGGKQFHDDSSIYAGGGNDTSDFYYFYNGGGSCSNLALTSNNNYVYGTKSIATDTDCSSGTNNQCNVDPGFVGPMEMGSGLTNYFQDNTVIDRLYLTSAISNSDETITCPDNCSIDYNYYSRGAVWDVGALDYGSVASGCFLDGEACSVNGDCCGLYCCSSTCSSTPCASIPTTFLNANLNGKFCL